MALKIQNSRQLLKRSTVSGATPTVFTGSTDYTDGTWGVDDIYAGELYLNMEDKKLWFGWETTGGTGVELIYPQAGTPGPSFTGGSGNCITDFYLTNMYGCSPINVWDKMWIQTGVTISSPDDIITMSFDNSGIGNFLLSTVSGGDNSQFSLTPIYSELNVANSTQNARLEVTSPNEIHLKTFVNTGEDSGLNIGSNKLDLTTTDTSNYSNSVELNNSVTNGVSIFSQNNTNTDISRIYLDGNTGIAFDAYNVSISQGCDIDITSNNYTHTYQQSATQLLIDGTLNTTAVSFDIRGEGWVQLTSAYNAVASTIIMQEAQIDINSLLTNMNGDVDVNGNLSANTVSATTYYNTPFELVAACSDETTPITTGTTKVTFRMPCAVNLTSVRASLTTAQTSGSTFTVDINSGGTSILSTKLTIDNTEKTSTTAATPAVLSSTLISDDTEITVDVDTVGSGTATGLKITLIGKRV